MKTSRFVPIVLLALFVLSTTGTPLLGGSFPAQHADGDAPPELKSSDLHRLELGNQFDPSRF